MRQFLLAGNVAYTEATDLSKVAEGALGVFYNKAGVPTVSATGTEFTGEGMLVLGRTAANGGPVVIPIHTNKFSFVKGVYSPATKFVGTIALPEQLTEGDFTVIVAKKGVKFNERNKWTATTHVFDATKTTVDAVGAKLAEYFNANSDNSGVTADYSSSTLTITAVETGVDYSIIGADALSNAEVTITTAGTPAYGDAKYVADLADKAAADAGFEYTYMDDVHYLYPKYPLNPLKASDAADTGFTIFTLKFAEPRNTKTHDDVVNQIVQVAIPTGAAAITKFETVLKGLAG